GERGRAPCRRARRALCHLFLLAPRGRASLRGDRPRGGRQGGRRRPDPRAPRRGSRPPDRRVLPGRALLEVLHRAGPSVRPARAARRAALAALAAALVAGCPEGPRTPSPPAPPPPAPPPVATTLVVFATALLASAVAASSAAFERAHRGVRV